MNNVIEYTATAVHENLRSHATHLHGHVERAEVVRRGVVEIADSHRHHDTFNLMCLADARTPLTDESAELSADYARQVRRPFSHWALGRDQVASAGRLLPPAGFVEGESERVMVASLDPAYVDRIESPLVVEVATSAAQVREYAELLAANWSPPATDVADFLTDAASYLTGSAPLSRLLIGRLDGHVVSGAEVHFAAGLAGVYGVASLESVRGRGFGSKIMSTVLELAARQGIAQSCLQATEDGAGIYRRFGYRQVDECQEFAIG